MLAERAKAIIEAHGHKAFDTVEGLLATSWEGSASTPYADIELGDEWCEAAIVFPVHFEPSPKDGFAIAHVDGKAVRHWLGY